MFFTNYDDYTCMYMFFNMSKQEKIYPKHVYPSVTWFLIYISYALNQESIKKTIEHLFHKMYFNNKVDRFYLKMRSYDV